jgi:hypothetical protein
MWYLYTVEFFSATENKILLFADKWIELENITLSEVSQVQKDKVSSFLLYVKYRPKTNTNTNRHNTTTSILKNRLC